MGKNYTNYHKMRDNNQEPVKEEVVEEVVEAVEETVDAEPVGEAVEEIVKATPVIGVVNCGRLNVRIAPDKAAPVVFEVTKLSELSIYEDKSTDEWYNVCTKEGVSGYCMKQFVTVK